MPNPLAWLCRKFWEFTDPTAHRQPSSPSAQDSDGGADVVDEQPLPQADAEHPTDLPPGEVYAEPDLIPILDTPRQTAGISLPGTNLPSIAPLERLLDDLWGYFRAQEAFIADEQEALQALQQKIETNQQWIRQYEGRGYPLEGQTAYEFNFERHRSRCYRQELRIYQRIRELRQQKIDSLDSNRSRIAMLLDNLRSELLKIDSFCTSIDTRFATAVPPDPCSEPYIQAQIDAFRQSFDESRNQERQTIADFNTQLNQLTAAVASH